MPEAIPVRAGTVLASLVPPARTVLAEAVRVAKLDNDPLPPVPDFTGTFATTMSPVIITGEGTSGAEVEVDAGEGIVTADVEDSAWSANLGALATGTRPLRMRQHTPGRFGGRSDWVERALSIPAQYLREATWDFDFINERAWIESARGQGIAYDLAGLLGQTTFSRASSATYFDSAGVLQTAATDALRFDHDPATLAPRGILIEGARTNLCTYSNDIANAAWTKSEATVTDNAGTSNDGTANADFVVEAATTANHYALTAGIAIGTATAYTATAIAKSTNRCLQFEFGSPRFGSNAWANFDLVNGTVGTVGSAATARIEALGGGWYRCHVTATATSSGNGSVRFSIVTAASSVKTESYAGDGTSGLFLTFVQVEAGTFASSYIATTTTSATRAADVLTAAVGGWFSASEGTWVADWSLPSVGHSINRNVTAISGAAANNSLGVIGESSSNTLIASAAVSGTFPVSIGLGATVAAQAEKVAFAYKNNDYGAARNGAAATQDSTGAVPASLTTVILGNSPTSGSPLFGHLRRVTYLPRRVSNAELQALSA